MNNFREYYEQEMLIEDIVVLDEEALIDVNRSLLKVFGGIRGAIQGIKKKIKYKTIKDPVKASKYMKNPIEITQNSFMAINAIGEEAFREWIDVKDEYGVIARTFINMRNAYVAKIVEYVIPSPLKDEKGIDTTKLSTNPKKRKKQLEKIAKKEALKKAKEETKQKMQAIKNGTVNDQGQIEKGLTAQEEVEQEYYNQLWSMIPDLKDQIAEIRNVRVHITTTGGFFATSQVTVNPNTKEQDVKYYFTYDAGGDKFFKKRFGISASQYIRQQANATPASIKKDVEKSSEKYNQLLKAFEAKSTSSKFYVKKDVDNNILKKMLDYAKTIPNTKEDKKVENGMTAYTITKETKNGRNPKVIFRNEKPGSPGEIWLNGLGKNAFKDIYALGGFDEVTNKKKEK